LEQSISRNSSRSIPSGPEKNNPQLKSLIKDQTFELDTQRKEMDSYKDQIIFMQKEVHYIYISLEFTSNIYVGICPMGIYFGIQSQQDLKIIFL
jgi:hypothetical protein